jgi:DNA-binding transcriptional regulator YdaS (Cro superfamily)
MKTDDVLAKFKTQEALAEQLGIKQPSIAKWVKTGVVPYLRQLQIESLTGGALKAEKGILPRKTNKYRCGSAQSKVIV